MSMQIFALLIVTVGFTYLTVRVFSPSNKSYFESMGKIPLDDAAPNDDTQDNDTQNNKGKG